MHQFQSAIVAVLKKCKYLWLNYFVLGSMKIQGMEFKFFSLPN